MRGQISSYGDKDIPFLLSVLVGLTGLTALDWLIEREARFVALSRKVDDVDSAGAKIHGGIEVIQQSLAELASGVDALRVRAHIGASLQDRLDIPHERIRRARKILWSGIALEYVLPQALVPLEEAVRHHADLTILIADPTSLNLRSELQTRIGQNFDRLDGHLKSAILNLQLLAAHLPKSTSFTLGFHQFVPKYGMLVIDPDDYDGLCYISFHHPNDQIGCVFVLHAQQDKHWFKIFTDQFELARLHTRLVEISAPADIDNSTA